MATVSFPQGTTPTIEVAGQGDQLEATQLLRSATDIVPIVNISATTQPGASTDADTVAVGIFEGEDAPSGLPDAAAQLIAAGEARPTPKALALAHADGKRWLLVGLGKRKDFTPERARAAAAGAHARALELSTRTLCWQVAQRRPRGVRGAGGGHRAGGLPLRQPPLGPARGRGRRPASTCRR